MRNLFIQMRNVKFEINSEILITKKLDGMI